MMCPDCPKCGKEMLVVILTPEKVSYQCYPCRHYEALYFLTPAMIEAMKNIELYLHNILHPCGMKTSIDIERRMLGELRVAFGEAIKVPPKTIKADTAKH